MASDGYTAGKPVQAGIRLKIDEGWHSYWVNPGEGGMPLGVRWTLPEGWVAGPLLHPVPKRFMTGELPGFGYEKEVIYPVFITPAAEAGGPAEIKAKVSWLTCDDAACVPGKAELAAGLVEEAGDPGPDAATLARSMDGIPQPLNGATLKVLPKDGVIGLEAGLPEEVDLTGAEVFPMTPAVVDHLKPIEFVKDGKVWKATVAPHEYAEGPPDELELVLAGGRLEFPLLLSWKAGD